MRDFFPSGSDEHQPIARPPLTVLKQTRRDCLIIVIVTQNKSKCDMYLVNDR